MVSEVGRDSLGAPLTNLYVYGLDLSGSMQGAGTIGGVLVADINGANAFYCYDANGNVSDLLQVSGLSPQPSLVAHYEYDPYGNTVVQVGALASENPSGAHQGQALS